MTQWARALSEYATRQLPSTAVTRHYLYDTVARAHLFGPPGHSIHPRSLEILRRVRWELMREGGPAAKAALLEYVLRLYAQASDAYHYDTSASERDRRGILLEQVQCMVEAKAGGVPMGASHYRHVLRSPQLAEVSPRLPLLLLNELLAVEATGGRATEDEGAVKAREDCCVGLASAGHAQLALTLCEPRAFPAIIARVAATRRDGWQQAWQLADSVPLEKLISGCPAERGWLEGFVEAARLRYQATRDPEVRSALADIIKVYAAPTPGCSSADRRPPRILLEAHVSVCPADAWEEALMAVCHWNSPTATNDTPAPVGEGVHNGRGHPEGEEEGGIRVGRAMAVLQAAQRSEEVLALFYNRDTAAAVLRSDSLTDDAVTTVDALTASGPFLASTDRRHPAVYNHAITALAALGKWELALQLYADRVCGQHQMGANVFTHIAAASAVLRASGEGVPKNDATYAVCTRALDAVSLEGGADADGLGETMALWAACRDDSDSVLRRASTAPSSWRYMPLIAIAALARKGEMSGGVADEELANLLTSLCQSPQCSVKQVCLAVTMVANIPAAMATCGDDRGELRGLLCEVVVDTLGRLINHSQPALDAVIFLLAEYLHSVQRHQQLLRQDGWICSLQRDKLLGSTMDQLRGTQANPDAWKVVRQIIAELCRREGLSAAKAAPAMISAGMSGDLAIHFIPE